MQQESKQISQAGANEQTIQAATPGQSAGSEQTTNPKKMKWWMWLIIALVFIALGIGTYFLINWI